MCERFILWRFLTRNLSRNNFLIVVVFLWLSVPFSGKQSVACQMKLSNLRTGTAQSVLWPGYVLNNAGFESRQKQENCSFPKWSDGFWDPPSSLLMGTRYLSWGVKRPGREAKHSLPSIAKVKNEWSSTASACAFMAAQGQLYLDPLISNTNKW